MSTSQLDDHGTDRREFIGRAAATGAGVFVGGGALGALVPSFAEAKKHGVKKRDLEILGAAQIAEALAVTTYSNIIDTAPFFKNLEDDDQGYLKAARQEEMSHYLLEIGATKKPSPSCLTSSPAWASKHPLSVRSCQARSDSHCSSPSVSTRRVESTMSVNMNVLTVVRGSVPALERIAATRRAARSAPIRSKLARAAVNSSSAASSSPRSP